MKNMKQEKKEAMLKLEQAVTGNRSLATSTRRFFTVPCCRRGLKIATIFILCVLTVTFFTVFIKNSHQPYRHHDERYIYFSRRNVPISIPSNSTTDGRTPTTRSHPALVIVAIILICISDFLIILGTWRLFHWLQTWNSEPSQHSLPLTDSGSSTTAADTAPAAWFVPSSSTSNRHGSRLREDEIQPVRNHHASSRMEVAPRRNGTGSRAPAGYRDSAVPTSGVSEALSSDESPEHRLVRRRRPYEDRAPHPSPCGSSATSPDHGCQVPDGGPTTEGPISTDPIQHELCYGEDLQGSFPRQDYDPIHDPYLHSGHPALDMDQTPPPDPMTLCSPRTDPAAQVLTSGEEGSGELLGPFPRQDYDPVHDPYLHYGDPAVDVDETAHPDPITLCSPSTDQAAGELASGEWGSRSSSSHTDWSGSISLRFQLSVPEASDDETGLGSADDGDAPTVTVAVAAGDDDDDGGGEDDDGGGGDDEDELSLASWVGSPVLPRR